MTMTIREPKNVRPDILRWLPSKWDHIIGNRTLKTFFKKLLRRLRKVTEPGQLPDLNRLAMLLVGNSRSGKSSMIKFFLRCLICEEWDAETMNPCDGGCRTCRQKFDLFGLEGFDVEFYTPEGTRRVKLAIVDCPKISGPSELRDKLNTTCHDTDPDEFRVMYFDEVHRLVDRQMDHMLLTAIEDRNFIWIFATAKPENLDEMFLNRLVKLKTEEPNEVEMIDWIIGRCNDWKINYEPEAVLRTVEKSNRIPGTALHALAIASLEPEEGLTLELVENEWDVKVSG